MSQGREITTAQVERMLDGLRHGMTRRAASAYGGFHFTSLYRMMDNQPTLATAVEKAEGDAEAAITAIVVDAMPKNWQAAAWWLERRKHTDYARRDKVEMTVETKREAERIAAELGMTVDEVLAEADAVLRGSR